MKTIIISLGLIAGFSLSSFSQVAPAVGNTPTTVKAVSGSEISVDKEIHNYGKIQKSSNGDCFFTITNTGVEPLIISKAKGSCGCTVPDWPKEAIAPGKSASMKVTYATSRVGKFTKTVTISSNATNSANKVIKITGEVLAAAPEDGAPFKKEKVAPLVK